MPRKTFTAGEVLAAADVNTFLMDQSVMTFADSDARGSAIPTPSEGMVTYLEDTNALEVFDGSSFVPTSAPAASGLVHISTISFSGSSSESFNDVFSSTYDNYMILGSGNSTLNDYINFRMRVAGVDNSTASSYITQLSEVFNTSQDLSRVTQTAGRISRFASAAAARSGFTAFIFDPFVAVTTSVRSNDKRADGPVLGDYAIHHNQTTSFDGITFLPNSGTMTGSISIYGLAKA